MVTEVDRENFSREDGAVLVPRGRKVWVEEGGGFFRLARKDSLGSRIAFSWDNFLLSSLPFTPPCTLLTGGVNEVVPASDGAVPASDEAVPASDGTVPASDGAVPASDEAVPTSIRGVPASNEAVPASDEAVPASDEAVPASMIGAPAAVLLPWGTQDDATLDTAGNDTEAVAATGVGLTSSTVGGWVFLWSLNEG